MATVIFILLCFFMLTGSEWTSTEQKWSAPRSPFEQKAIDSPPQGWYDYSNLSSFKVPEDWGRWTKKNFTELASVQSIPDRFKKLTGWVRPPVKLDTQWIDPKSDRTKGSIKASVDNFSYFTFFKLDPPGGTVEQDFKGNATIYNLSDDKQYGIYCFDANGFVGSQKTRKMSKFIRTLGDISYSQHGFISEDRRGTVYVNTFDDQTGLFQSTYGLDPYGKLMFSAENLPGVAAFPDETTGKAASASCATTSGPADDAIDNDPNTMWEATYVDAVGPAGTDATTWWKVDLGSNRVISTGTILLYEDAVIHPRVTTVLGSTDDATWFTIKPLGIDFTEDWGNTVAYRYIVINVACPMIPAIIGNPGWCVEDAPFQAGFYARIAIREVTLYATWGKLNLGGMVFKPGIYIDPDYTDGIPSIISAFWRISGTERLGLLNEIRIDDKIRINDTTADDPDYGLVSVSYYDQSGATPVSIIGANSGASGFLLKRPDDNSSQPSLLWRSGSSPYVVMANATVISHIRDKDGDYVGIGELKEPPAPTDLTDFVYDPGGGDCRGCATANCYVPAFDPYKAVTDNLGDSWKAFYVSSTDPPGTLKEAWWKVDLLTAKAVTSGTINLGAGTVGIVEGSNNDSDWVTIKALATAFTDDWGNTAAYRYIKVWIRNNTAVQCVSWADGWCPGSYDAACSAPNPCCNKQYAEFQILELELFDSIPGTSILFKYDGTPGGTEGDLIFTTSFESGVSLYSITQDPKGGAYFVSGAANNHAYIARINSASGSKELSGEFSSGTSLASINPSLENGGLIGIGNYDDGAYSYLYALKIDHALNEEWHKTYGIAGQNAYGKNAIESRNKGYLISGELKPMNKIYLIKTNRYGESCSQGDPCN